MPRDVEVGSHADAVRAALAVDRRRLWAGGSELVSHVPLTAPLRSALAALAARGMLVRGLETADAELAAERRGLDALADDVRARQGLRVSRVLVVSGDGSERFYRHVERLAAANAPRVLVCRVECTSAELGGVACGEGAEAKLVMTSRKSAAATLLEALSGV